MTTRSLSNQVAIVTGAGSGIGRATAVELAARGASVCCADINVDAATLVAGDIKAAGGTAFAQEVDITVPEQNEAMVGAVVERYGRLDLAHLNAGIPSPTQIPLDQMPIEDFDRVVSINLRGTFLGIRACARSMRATGGGAMVLTSSLSGIRVSGPGTAAYVASKHGIVGLAKIAAVDLSAYGIRVNVICPGTIDTELFAARFGNPEERRATLNQRSARIPVRRLGEANEVAGLVAYLLSDEAGYITGGTFEIDGGVSVMSGGLRALPDLVDAPVPAPAAG